MLPDFDQILREYDQVSIFVAFGTIGSDAGLALQSGSNCNTVHEALQGESNRGQGPAWGAVSGYASCVLSLC